MLKSNRDAFFLLVLFLLGSVSLATPLRFSLEAGPQPLLTLPVAVELPGVKLSPDAELVRIEGGQRIPLNWQIDNENAARLWFIPDRSIPAGQTVTLALNAQKPNPFPPTLLANVTEEAIHLTAKHKHILRYYRAEHDVPVGVDPVFRRSAFIHPLWSPGGAVLTRIQPPDHYHHYGIWNPWTKTHIDGREVDFWNLAKKQGTVRHVGIHSTVGGSVFAGFQVHHEHIDLNPTGQAQVAIDEQWTLRAFACTIDWQSIWVIDLITELKNKLSAPITLDQYRYGGGLGFRATDDWTKDNTTILTSDGKTRENADGTRARWCLTAGTINEQPSGILFCSHPQNRQHPEPMRVWPTDAVKGKGYLFIEYCPIRLQGWVLTPGQSYTLRYRMVVYDGSLKPETAEQIWQHFTAIPKVEVKP